MSNNYLITESLKKRFESHVSAEPNTGCWIWTGACEHRGYGHLGVNGFTKAAHRVSWEIYIGPVPTGFQVCHSCDTRICVNPYHLFLGTQVDNMQDCIKKNRFSAPPVFKGSAHPHTKFSESDIIHIRSDKRLPRIIAADYNVFISTIYKIKTYETWKHVP